MTPTSRPTRSITIEQSALGYQQLQAQLRATGVSAARILVVLEATGSYWISLATRLVDDGFAVAVINPSQARDFATRCPTPEAAASHAGLAPYVRSSGSSIRGRAQIGQAGNRHLRRALSLATFSAVRYNPAIKAFYDRLRAAGKPPKVARGAAARKLLHIAWAVVTKDCDFDPRMSSRKILP